MERKQFKQHIVTIEDLVPEDNIFRQLASTLELSFIPDRTHEWYHREKNAPPIDSITLAKFFVAGYLHSSPSLSLIEEAVRNDVATRWYLELDLFDPVPDHNAVNQIFQRDPDLREVYRLIFVELAQKCIDGGYVLVMTKDGRRGKPKAELWKNYMDVQWTPEEYWEKLNVGAEI